MHRSHFTKIISLHVARAQNDHVGVLGDSSRLTILLLVLQVGFQVVQLFLLLLRISVAVVPVVLVLLLSFTHVSLRHASRLSLRLIVIIQINISDSEPHLVLHPRCFTRSFLGFDFPNL